MNKKTNHWKRPSSASGKLESAQVKHVLEDIRPITVPIRDTTTTGMDPTYITSQRQVGGTSTGKSTFQGRQVHGGINPNDISVNRGRRATLGPTDNLNNQREKYLQRPETTNSKDRAVKIEENITLEHLYKMKDAFEEADWDGSGTLDMEEFKSVFKHYLGLKSATDVQMTALFMKIDASSDGEINWDEFCTYMQLEYAEKEESYLRSKETAFHLPATIENSPHREPVLRMCHTSDSNYLNISQDGMVSFWSENMIFKRVKQIESGTKKSKWITDFVLMPHYNKFITATGDREIQFYELSTFEPYCQISGLETVPLCLDYCAPGPDECIILYGDAEGAVGIFMMTTVGEVLRTWKKMPRLDGIASVSIESFASHAHVKFVRWKVHDDWIQEMKYYDSIRSVISSSSDQNYSLVIGPTTSSTYGTTGEANEKSMAKKTAGTVSSQGVKRRFESDETVFKVYKGVKTFDFCKEKNLIVTGGMDRLVRLWDPYVPSKPIGLLRGHTTPLFYVFIDAEDNRIFSISNDKVIKVWDLHDQSCLLTVRPKAHKIRGDLFSIHYNPVSRALAIATDHINMLRIKGRPLSIHLTTTHKEAVLCAKYNSSFDHVVTASENSIVRIWDITTGTAVFEFSNAHNGQAITCMSFDSTERRLVTGARDGKLKIWNYNNAHCLQTLEKEKCSTEVTDLIYVVLNKNRYIVSVGWDRRISLFSDDQIDFRHVQHPYAHWSDDIHNGHKEDVLSVAFCPPNFLATSSYDGEIIVWNMISGHLFGRLKSSLLKSAPGSERLEGKLAVNKLLFLSSRSDSKEAASLVSSGPKGMIHFWNVYDEKEAACFEASKYGFVSALTSNQEGTILYIGDTQGFVMAYDVSHYAQSDNEVSPPEVAYTWRAHIQSITCLEYAGDFDVIVTTSVDWTARMFTSEGHFIGTFGQPKMWDISLPSTFQHPMVPYDVLMDPLSLPKHPTFVKRASLTNTRDVLSKLGITVGKDNDQSLQRTNQKKGLRQREGAKLKMINDEALDNLINSNPSATYSGKRLRHERLQRIPKINSSTVAAYQFLDYHELNDTPTSSENKS